MNPSVIKLRKEKGLRPFGTGAQMMDQIEKLYLAFTFAEDIDSLKGRELLFYAVDTFVSIVNDEEKIHPYLANSPFTHKNIEVVIFLKNPDGSEVTAGKLAVIESMGGVFKHMIKDLEANQLRTVYRETYEEALDRPEIVWKPEPLLDLSKMLKNGSKIGILKEEKDGSFSIDSYPKKD